MNTRTDQPKILVLYSETGGTHRNAAEAIQEAIEIQYPDQYDVKLVDIWSYCGWPLKNFPSVNHLFRAREIISKSSMRYSDHVAGLRFFQWFTKPFLRRIVDRMMVENPCDLIVSVHPLVSAPVIEILNGKNEIPIVVVVSDLATQNIFWFHPDVDFLILPSEQTQRTALRVGMDWKKIFLLGVPVGMKYCVKLETQAQIQNRLGLDTDKPVILLAGGQQGVGPIRTTAEILDHEFNGINLVIISGRNKHLQSQLQGTHWNNHVIIKGYVEEIWDWMWAADILISKAGTGMLAEALSVGVPMILFNRVPYLEDANVSFLVNQGAAIWAPTPKSVANALKYWLERPQEREKAEKVCRRLAKPEAARQLADVLTDIADGKIVSV